MYLKQFSTTDEALFFAEGVVEGWHLTNLVDVEAWVQACYDGTYLRSIDCDEVSDRFPQAVNYIAVSVCGAETVDPAIYVVAYNYNLFTPSFFGVYPAEGASDAGQAVARLLDGANPLTLEGNQRKAFRDYAPDIWEGALNIDMRNSQEALKLLLNVFKTAVILG